MAPAWPGVSRGREDAGGGHTMVGKVETAVDPDATLFDSRWSFVHGEERWCAVHPRGIDVIAPRCTLRIHWDRYHVTGIVTTSWNSD